MDQKREELNEQIEILKNIRKDIGLNRREFSEYMGIPLRTLEEWEAGRRKMPGYVLRLIVYQVKMDQSKHTGGRNITIVQDADGNNIVMINDIYFKGKRSVDWDEVKKYLKTYIGEFYTIIETEDVIYIGNDLPDEYTGSKYTHSLKGAAAKAKANAVQGIPEMIEIAVGKHFRENRGNKHKRNAQNGWCRYDFRFALPVYGNQDEIDRYNVFHASILIRHASDGKMYLYDIIDIKKETSNSFES